MFRVGRRMQLDEQSNRGERLGSETSGRAALALSRAVHVTNATVKAKFASSCQLPVKILNFLLPVVLPYLKYCLAHSGHRGV